MGFADWFRAHRPEDAEYIQSVQHEIAHHTSIDYDAIEAELKSVLEERAAA